MCVLQGLCSWGAKSLRMCVCVLFRACEVGSALYDQGDSGHQDYQQGEAEQIRPHEGEESADNI